jgi:hypothetical protein
MGNQVVISPDRSRSIYSGLEKWRKEGYIVSPGFVRVEQAIVNGKTVYTFPVTKDANSDTVTEEKLDRNDKFHVSHMGLFLMKRLSTKTGIEVLQAYPNILEFADVSSTFLGADLEVFYNGKLAVKVGQTVWIEKMDTRRFRSVEEVQQAAASTKSSAKEHSGFIELTPQILLDGNEKNEIKIEAPVHSSALVAHTTASTSNYLVMMFRGFLITRK